MPVLGFGQYFLKHLKIPYALALSLLKTADETFDKLVSAKTLKSVLTDLDKLVLNVLSLCFNLILGGRETRSMRQRDKRKWGN